MPFKPHCLWVAASLVAILTVTAVFAQDDAETDTCKDQCGTLDFDERDNCDNSKDTCCEYLTCTTDAECQASNALLESDRKLFLQLNCGVCFPGSAAVRAENGREIPMRDLKVGDLIASDAESGSLTPVLFFGHRKPSSSFPFTTISFDHGKRDIKLSGGHYLRVGGELKTARKVQLGDQLHAAEPGVSGTVTAVEHGQKDQGLFNPHTASGRMVVNGVEVSCYTEVVAPVIAHILVIPLRVLARFGLGGIRLFESDAPAWLSRFAVRMELAARS